MPKLFTDYEARVAALLKADATKLTQGDQDDFIRQAITQRYSNDRAQVLVADVNGDGSQDLALPAGFVDQFSAIRKIEYPVGQIPISYLIDDDWVVYQEPTSKVVRILSTAIESGKPARLTFTAPHAEDASTIPDADFYAVCDYAASLCAETIAAIYAATRDAGLQADTVNWRTKQQEWASQAKLFRQRYYNQLGIEDGAKGGGAAEQPPAIAISQQHETLAVGLDRLTHPKSTRK